MLIEYNDDLIAIGKFSSSCGTPLQGIARLCDAGNCATITGSVRHDLDGICDTRNGDRMLRGHVVEIRPGLGFAVSDSSGVYRTMAPNGSYTLSAAPRLYWDQLCPAAQGSHAVTVAMPGGLYDGLDFAEQPIPNIHDLRATLTHGLVRPGRATSIALTVENVGTVVERYVHVTLNIDAGLAYTSASVTPVTISGGRITWELDSLAPDETRTIVVALNAATTLESGSEVCSSVYAECPSEHTPLDNVQRCCTQVRASYDPNEIAVSPAGTGVRGEIAPEDTVLTYTIRFQNTGNDTAFTVAVYDTLPPNVDPVTLSFGPASHRYAVTNGPGNALIWRFENIMLPDSTTNEARSHGYFSYSIRLRPGLAPGTSIANNASIYFDYNTPVRTNTVTTTIPESSADVAPMGTANGLTIAPNPVRNRMVLLGALPIGSTLSIRSMLGTTVRTMSAAKIADGTIDVADLPSGYYLLVVGHHDHSATLPFVVAR